MTQKITHVLEIAIQGDGIHKKFLDTAVADRFTRMLSQVVGGILSGEIQSGIHEKRFGNPHMVNEYREGLRGLLKTIQAV